MPHDYARAAIFLAAFWALCALVHPAVRRALLEGTRCVGRYPDLWRIPAIFGFGYAIFQFAAAAVFHWRMQENLASWLTTAGWEPPPAAAPLILASLAPAAERSAAVFTIFTATFPLSAIFALLLLCNFRGLLAEMAAALQKRLGAAKGLLVLAPLLLTALCAILKPAVYLLLPEIAERAPVLAAMAVNFLSIIFELLLGIFFLTYLMLMTHAWMRGLFFHRYKLFHVAMRRTGFVLKWSLTMAVLEIALVVLPLYVGIFVEGGPDFYDSCAWFSNEVGRPVVIAVALICCPVQAILVFHNESLRQALRDSTRLLRTRWMTILPFLGSACAAFLLLEAASDFVGARLGPETAAALGSRVITAWIEALLAGWLIASWVCLYKSVSTGRKEILF